MYFYRVDLRHNKAVTDKIIKDIISDGSYKEHSDIACKYHKLTSGAMYKILLAYYTDAAKKYHEYLVRQQKPQTAEQKKKVAKNNRIVQRRQRVCVLIYL